LPPIPTLTIQGKDYWAAHPARIFFEHILDLVMHYCRRPFVFKQLGGSGEVFLSLASIRQGMQVLQRRQQQQAQADQQQAGTPDPEQPGAAAALEAPPTDPALAKKVEEVKELRAAITFAKGQIKSDASSIQNVTHRYEGAKVEVEIAAKSCEMTSSQIDARLDDQEKRLATIEDGPAAVRQPEGPVMNEMEGKKKNRLDYGLFSPVQNTSVSMLPPPSLRRQESIKTRIQVSREQAVALKKNNADNQKKMNSLLAGVNASLQAVAPQQVSREPQLSSATYMLELAEKALAAGNDPGDVKMHLTGLLTSAESAATSVLEGIASAQRNLGELEALLAQDSGMASELGEIDIAIASVSEDNSGG
jgi:hypothetical protein